LRVVNSRGAENAQNRGFAPIHYAKLSHSAAMVALVGEALRFLTQGAVVMKTSLRLAFSALAVSAITLAAAGAPLPFLTDLNASAKPAPTRLLPPGADGEAHTIAIGAPASFGAQ
jgi:hypothetical protein